MTKMKGIRSFSGSLPEKGWPEAIGTAPGVAGPGRREAGAAQEKGLFDTALGLGKGSLSPD